MKLFKKLVAEFYASALFTFTVFCTSNNSIIVGLGYWMVIQGTGYINPFHLNPLVQLCIYIHKRVTGYLRKKERIYFLYSIPVQILGSLVGALFSWWIYDSEFYFMPNPNVNAARYFFAEAIFSSHIVLISLGIGQWAESRLIGLLAISGGITAGINTVGWLSGACFNPTMCFLINFVQAMRSGDSESLNHLWLYIFAPMVGAVPALILGLIIHPRPEKKKMTSKPSETIDATKLKPQEEVA